MAVPTSAQSSRHRGIQIWLHSNTGLRANGVVVKNGKPRQSIKGPLQVARYPDTLNGVAIGSALDSPPAREPYIELLVSSKRELS